MQRCCAAHLVFHRCSAHPFVIDDYAKKNNEIKKQTLELLEYPTGTHRLTSVVSRRGFARHLQQEAEVPTFVEMHNSRPVSVCGSAPVVHAEPRQLEWG